MMKILAIVFVLLPIAFTVPAVNAIGGSITSPQLGHRAGVGEKAKKKLHGLLEYMRMQLTFIEGSFVNQFAHQRYGGTAAQTARFIDLLEDAGLWQVQVVFRDFGEQVSAFSMDQDSGTQVLRVMVNSGREDFNLREFREHLPKPGLPFAAPGADPTLELLKVIRPGLRIEEPEFQGRELAAADRRRGVRRVFYYGKPWSQGKPLVDEKSGLPVTIAAGCSVVVDFVKLVEAYNSAMRDEPAAEKR